VNKANETAAKWMFLTHHAHILLCLTRFPEMRMRDLAVVVGITERTVHRIISDLAGEGFIKIRRNGRCNSYSVNEAIHLKQTLEAHRDFSDFIQLLYHENDHSEKGDNQ
jgi:DNA-binding MarR family transcriptional regulator